MIYSPVLITTIFRADKFKKCIDSLSRCNGSEHTELYIGVDYPAKESHWEGYRQICDFLPCISGFKEVHVVKHERNVGQSKNVISLQELVRLKYDRYILSEDDNEFAQTFLDYMNQCLEKYKDNPCVTRVCGYSYDDWNPREYSYNAFPLQGFSAWGFGTWFNKRDEYANSNFPKIDGIINNPCLVGMLFKKKMHIPIHQMMYRTKNKIFGADVRFRCFCAINEKFCIFPTVSKVRNLGFDGESTNCLPIDSFAKQQIDENKTFELDVFEIKHYKAIDKIHDKQYAGAFLKRLAIRLEYIWWRKTGKVMGDSDFFRVLVRLRIKLLGK